LQGEPKESVAAASTAAAADGKDGPCETEDIAVSLEHVEENVKGVDQTIAEVRCLKVFLFSLFQVK